MHIALETKCLTNELIIEFPKLNLLGVLVAYTDNGPVD